MIFTVYHENIGFNISTCTSFMQRMMNVNYCNLNLFEVFQYEDLKNYNHKNG